MTTELFWLTLTALLAASLWVPYIYGVNTTPVPQPEGNRPHDVAGTVPWVHRAYRAHLNLLEQLLPFAALVLIAHLVGVSNEVTVWATIIFFFLRLAHVVWMIGGYPVLPVRPLLFTGGWICTLVVGGAILIG